MKKLIILAAVAAALCVAPAVFAQTDAAVEVKVFDSTDNYLGGCLYTDSSEWTLDEDIDVITIQLWYYWQQEESELPVTVQKDGVDFASFTAERSACDPYQTSWCNADYAINKTFPAGTYTTKVENAYQCLKPGSTGTVRLYAAAVANSSEEPNLITGSNSNLNANADSNANVTAEADDTIDEEEEDDDDATMIVLVVVILALLVVIYFLIRRKTAQIRSQQQKQ